MFGAVMRFVGLVRVSVARNQIILSGLPGDLLAKDITKMWSSGRVTNNLFTKITRSHVSFNRFFLIEVAYVVEQLYETNQRTYTSKRLLKAALDELVNKTWLKDLSKQKDYRPRLDLRNLDKFIKSPLPHQMKFLEIYNEKVSQFHLNGYMLAAGAGLGKTLTQLFLAETLGSDIVIIICPNNALERVWETELATQFKQTPLYWTSVNSGPAPHDAGIKYFVFHYEALDRALDLVRRLKGRIRNCTWGLMSRRTLIQGIVYAPTSSSNCAEAPRRKMWSGPLERLLKQWALRRSRFLLRWSEMTLMRMHRRVFARYSAGTLNGLTTFCATV